MTVPGPGPNEIRNETAPTDDTEEADESAPAPAAKTEAKATDEDEDGGSEDDDDDDEARPVNRDPYSNLDGAFGNYVTDQPRPMAANARGRANEEDDVLF